MLRLRPRVRLTGCWYRCRTHSLATLLLSAAMVLCASPTAAQIGAYPDLYDPTKLRTLYLDMTPADWDTIRFDTTFDIEVPAMFWAEGEAPILVSVRRKSADALPDTLDPVKISMKVDINEYVDDQIWHGVKKLSLENGDDVNVVTEGFAWYLHRLATGFRGSPYAPGLAAWARVVVNGQDLGVYVNLEQPDKTFLKNRGLHIPDETWFYKQDGVDYVELKAGDSDSPSYLTLCYSPFRAGSAVTCPSPSDGFFVQQVSDLIDMETMFICGAVSAFTDNPDDLFSKGKNFYFADFLSGQKRLHFPWDLDAAMGNLDADAPIYNRARGPGKVYEDLIIDNPAFRPLYDQIFVDLLAGPLREANLIAFLNQSETLIGEALSADPNNQIGEDVGGFFDILRSWVSERIAGVSAQLPALPPTTAVGEDVAPAPIVSLGPVLPNPVRTGATMSFTLPVTGDVTLEVFDIKGRRIYVLVDGKLGPGTHHVNLSGDSGDNVPRSSGIYVARLEVAGQTFSRKFAVIH